MKFQIIQTITLVVSTGSTFMLVGCGAGFQAASQSSVGQIASQSLFPQRSSVDNVCYTPSGALTDCPPTPTPTSTPNATPTPTFTPDPNYNPEIPNPTATPMVNPTATPAPAPAPEPVAPNAPSPVALICSNGLVDNLVKGSVKGATTLQVQYVDTAGNVACQYNDTNARAGIINERSITLPSNLNTLCPNIVPGTYALHLNSDGGPNLLAVDDPNMMNFVNFALDGKPASYAQRQYLSIAYDFFMQAPVEAQVNVLYVTPTQLSASRAGMSTVMGVLYDHNPVNSSYMGFDVGGCDAAASPLVLQLVNGTEAAQAVNFSAPLSGIRFDIKGQNASPKPHALNQISWFTPESAVHNYMLVLPGAHGAIRGIDQLFGDNTVGPDGKTASNGYEALRKYDGRNNDGTFTELDRDGMIDAKDPIFTSLRMWSDLNADGIAQANELHSLTDLGVTSINLNYDAHYSEADKYGNEIKMKSAFSTKDGLQHVMYDVWFRIVD